MKDVIASAFFEKTGFRITDPIAKKHGVEKRTNMKIYNVHYGINGEEHDYVIEAMSESDALTSCWCENAEGEEGEDTYIALWIEELPECEENRNLCRRI